MWIFTRYGFFSIACASKPDGSPDAQTVMVRARRSEHLGRLQGRFPALADASILTMPDRDYRYRIVVAKDTWAKVISELATEQEWSNFKNEVARYQGAGGREYVHALHEVWGTMAELQATPARVRYGADGAIANAAELSFGDVANRRVLCPACGGKTFDTWPQGWDGHAGHACTVEGGTPEERKETYKRRFRHLFR
jgi:hypothetical protein